MKLLDKAGGWFVRCGLWLRASCTTSNQLSVGPGQAKASHPAAPQPKHPNCGRTGTIVINGKLLCLTIPCPQAMDMACWGLVPRFWVKDKGFKEDDAVWGDAAQKSKPTDPPPEATELREGAFVATILCDDREEEMEENMEQVNSILVFLGNSLL